VRAAKVPNGYHPGSGVRKTTLPRVPLLYTSAGVGSSRACPARGGRPVVIRPHSAMFHRLASQRCSPSGSSSQSMCRPSGWTVRPKPIPVGRPQRAPGVEQPLDLVPRGAEGHLGHLAPLTVEDDPGSVALVDQAAQPLELPAVPSTLVAHQHGERQGGEGALLQAPGEEHVRRMSPPARRSRSPTPCCRPPAAADRACCP
jgi:hypothetical protein